ncbi:MAG: YitT family protein [Chlamydiota bacterium]|nr:YitT family protein [Chlamydiota bacterium]
MITQQNFTHRSWKSNIFSYLMMALGAFFAAFAIEVFLIPSNLIDGGIVGVSMILGSLTKNSFIPIYLIIFNAPFIYLAYKFIGKVFVIHFFFAVLFFSCSMALIQSVGDWTFRGESLEVVVIGGCIMGIGFGMIIRFGGCLDGTEILGIILNRKTGITVGQVVLFCNIFIFAAAGIVFQDWHPPILSLITYMVVIKVMDYVIVGLDETKSVMIISAKSREISEAIIHELGLGLTIMYGRGGFSGDEREILYVIAERLQLSELKELIHREDPTAFIAIENLHEVSYGAQGKGFLKKENQLERLIKQIWTTNAPPPTQK